MSVPVDHIERLRKSATKVVTGLYEMRQTFQEIESLCLDWIDDAGPIDEPHVTRAEAPVEPSGNSEPAPQPAPQPTPPPSIEEVRSVLAELAQAGKADHVKDLITRHGATRLSDINPEHWQELMTEAETLK